MASGFSSTTHTIPPALAEVSFPDRCRFTRADYHRLVELGFLEEDAKVELLNGEIVAMSPIGPDHSNTVDLLAECFIVHVRERFQIRVQGPQAADEWSEPEPDLQVLRRAPERYRRQHPTGADAVLIVEVAKTSLTKDLGPKKHVYAAAGVPEYWVVDLKRRVVVVHRDVDPVNADYRSISEAGPRGQLAPQAAADCQLDLAWLFGDEAEEDASRGA